MFMETAITWKIQSSAKTSNLNRDSNPGLLLYMHSFHPYQLGYGHDVFCLTLVVSHDASKLEIICES